MACTEVFAWGSDEEGQLGLGDNRSRRYYQFPRFCSFNALISELACGKDHTAMIASNGFLYMMGSNAFGKLGIGTTARSCVSPSLVDSLSNTTVKHVSCGFNHTVCCSQNGELFTWGDNSSGQLGVGEGLYQSPTPKKLEFPHLISNVASGNYHTMLLTSQNSLLAFGLGEQGQLGLGSVIDRQFKPAVLPKLPGPVNAVAAGNYFTIMIISGKLYGCGDNQYGQLGINKSTVRALYPSKSTQSILDKTTFVSVQAKSYSAALSIDNDLYVFGSISLPEPAKVPVGKVHQFAIGSAFGVAIDTSGRAFSWGELSRNFQPLQLESLQDKKISKIAAGEQHVMAIGGGSGFQKSQSQSRISSDGRRSDLQSGKISRQQSATQLNSMLQKNHTEYATNQATRGFNETMNSTKQQKRPFQHFRTKENTDDAEVYKSLQQQSCLNNSGNQRAITPTQNRKVNGSRNPLQISNVQGQEFESINSNLGNRMNFQGKSKMPEEGYEAQAPQFYKKAEDRCKSEYVQNNYVHEDHQSPTRVYSRQLNEPDQQTKMEVINKKLIGQELVQQVNLLKTQLQEKENQLIVIQSECNDSKIKLTRRIRQLEDQLESKEKQLQKSEQFEKELVIFKSENYKLLDKIKSLESERYQQEVIADRKSRQQQLPPPAKLRCQPSGQKKVEESESFMLSQITEQSPNRKIHIKQDQLAKEFLRISPILDKREEITVQQHVKTISNYEMDESLDFKKLDNRGIEGNRGRDDNRDKVDNHGRKSPEDLIYRKNHKADQPPGTNQNQSQNEWWSNEKEKKPIRPSTNIKQREPSQNAENNNNSEVFKTGQGYKQNIQNLNSKLTDIRKTKSALENRMRQFEEKIKDRKKVEIEK